MNAQSLSFLYTISIIGLLLWMIVLLFRPRWRLFALCPLSLLIHIAAFITSVTYFAGPKPDVDFYNSWSILVWIHAIGMVAGGGLAVIIAGRGR